jgi:iron complex outermembrane receptor protein
MKQILKAGIGYSNSSFSSVLRYNYNKLDLGIPEDGIAAQSSNKHSISRQGVFNHLLSLNSYLKDSKLDVDLGMLLMIALSSNSDIAGLKMK